MGADKATAINSAEVLFLVQGLLDELDDSALLDSPAKPKTAYNTEAESLKTSKKSTAYDISGLLEGAETWDWDDMLDDVAPKKDPDPIQSTLKPSPYVQPTLIRCRVTTINEESLHEKPCKKLTVEGCLDNLERVVILLDEWQYTDIFAGDIVHVILTSSTGLDNLSTPLPHHDMPIEISASRNYIILHPDLLISATLISQTSYCARRPIIASLVSNSNFDPEPSLFKNRVSLANVWGNFVHEIVQQSLKDGLWDSAAIILKVDNLLKSPRGIAEIFRAGISIEQAKREISQRTQGLSGFGKRYLCSEPRQDAKLANTRSSDTSSLLSITRVHDIEEDMLSPSFGIKGKVDACLQIVVQEEHSRKGKGELSTKLRSHRSAPFEIKTGKATGVMEHRAQTILYTLLMAERYGVEIPSGLLFYTQAAEVIEVPRASREMRSLMVRRNDLAEHLMRRRREETANSFLPKPLEDNWACSRCYAVDSCMLYRKAVERVEGCSTDVAELYAKKTGHLTETQCDFFRHWESLISLEEQDIHRFRQELWSLTAQDRENAGRCFAEMVLADGPQGIQTLQEAKSTRYNYSFCRSSFMRDRTLLQGHLHAGDPVCLSIEPNLLLLARGFLIGLTPEVATVAIDKELIPTTLLSRLPSGSSLKFRIDKDELSGGIARMRENLALLFYENGNAHRRSLLVDLAPPAFSIPPLSQVFPDALNEDQRAAVTKVLRAKDYALILGMPGTGKTMTIAAIIRLLVSRNNTVLLASYTHSAVDNIILKLLDADINILRIGNVDKVHPAARKFTLDGNKLTSLRQYEDAVMASPVVATTCLSIDHPLFSRRRFDYCIIDEASQITLPTCLGPLRFAEKFVLVGDHFQLPPLVRSREAKKGGYDISLFRVLSNAHPEAISELARQYRMNEDIMTISNTLIYNNKLQCGSDQVAQRGLYIPNPAGIAELHRNVCQPKDCWLERLLKESTKAIFVDTDLVPAHETYCGNLIQNDVEALLVHQTVDCLLRCQVKQDDIGVVSLYRQQLKLITSMLDGKEGVELLTADKSQGRDKECIIISMVRSNDKQQTGDLLKDWRRINVAFTRARSKLIIFGSRKTLSSLDVLRQFLELMENRGWILTLRPGADKTHAFSSSPKSTKRKDPHQGSENREAAAMKKAKVLQKDGWKLPSAKMKRTILGDIVNNIS